MPVYEYYCTCGCERDEILPFAEFNRPQVCECGEAMKRKIPHTSFTMRVYANNMALEQLNKRGNGQYQGMPNRWWKPFAERKAFEGTQRKEKAVW